jgi:hypothetical protein
MGKDMKEWVGGDREEASMCINKVELPNELRRKRVEEKKSIPFHSRVIHWFVYYMFGWQAVALQQEYITFCRPVKVTKLNCKFFWGISCSCCVEKYETVRRWLP